MTKYINPLDPPTAVSSAPQTASTVASTVVPNVPSDSDIQALGELLDSLKPEELEKLKRLTKSTPVLSGMLKSDGNLVTLPDGRVQATIILSPDLIEPLTAWAESAQISLGEQVQQIAETAITNYLYQDWGSVVPSNLPKTGE